MNSKILATALIAAAYTLSGPVPASAQHVAGGIVVEHNNLDVAVVATGWSMVKLLRGSVRNKEGEFVGYVHDAIVAPNGVSSFVIVNVAGFLNIGEKLVALPTPAFEVDPNGDLILPNATKEKLKALPRFYYARN